MFAARSAHHGRVRLVIAIWLLATCVRDTLQYLIGAAPRRGAKPWPGAKITLRNGARVIEKHAPQKLDAECDRQCA
jgi:hypothetical protein